MALEQLIADLITEAEEEAAQILAAAKQKAAQLQKEEEQQLSKLKQQELAAYDQELAEVKKRSQALAKLKARDKLVKAKNKIIADFYAALLQELNQLPTADYLNFLIKVLNSRSHFGGEVVLGKEDSQLGEELIRKANKMAGKKVFTLSQETHNLGRGLILKQDRISETLTLAELIKQFRAQTEVSVAKELFND